MKLFKNQIQVYQNIKRDLFWKSQVDYFLSCVLVGLREGIINRRML